MRYSPMTVVVNYEGSEHIVRWPWWSRTRCGIRLPDDDELSVASNPVRYAASPCADCLLASESE